MLKLENIGFYTLSDERAKTASSKTSLQRCELLITDACNFKCPYCRGPKEFKGHTPLSEATRVLEYWASQGLRNVRFSGGEPTVYPWIVELIAYAKYLGIERIAISTNGSAKTELYTKMVGAGANDFSVSFDACCASGAEAMAGGIPNIFNRICDNIRHLSNLTYVTLGIVVTPDNINDLKAVVKQGHDLGAQDIRIISSAQFNQLLEVATELDSELLTHPILKYRIDNIKKGRGVRGLQFEDSHKCGLMLDDMVVQHGMHYPCVIYMREHGDPIGPLDENTREARQRWYDIIDTHKSIICKQNCLDVCIDYNNKFARFKLDKIRLPKLNPLKFTGELWSAGSIHDLGVNCRTPEICSISGKTILREHVIGWCHGENVTYRPKENHVAVMVDHGDHDSWFHLTVNEFLEVFGG